MALYGIAKTKSFGVFDFVRLCHIERRVAYTFDFVEYIQRRIRQTVRRLILRLYRIRRRLIWQNLTKSNTIKIMSLGARRSRIHNAGHRFSRAPFDSVEIKPTEKVEAPPSPPRIRFASSNWIRDGVETKLN